MIGVTDPSPLIPFLWQPFKFQCLSPESVFDFPYSSSCLSSETSSQFHPIRMTANEDDSSNNMFQFQHFTEEEIRTKFLSGNYDDKYGDAVQLEVRLGNSSCICVRFMYTIIVGQSSGRTYVSRLTITDGQLGFHVRKLLGSM
jgi:hypothetical protein